MSELNKYRPSREWLLKMADLEDSVQSIAVGGMADDVGLMPRPQHDHVRVLGRLVELARRKMRLSLEELAEKARVELEDLFRIEEDDDFQPSVRTVYQLASTLKLPAEKLLELTGLVKTDTTKSLSDAAIRFAARSETNAKLTREEKEALDEFVKVLVEGSD